MREELQEIREHILEIYRILERNTTTLERNTDELAEHIRRTELLEEKMETALIPVRYGKFLLAVLSVAATLAAIYSALVVPK